MNLSSVHNANDKDGFPLAQAADISSKTRPHWLSWSLGQVGLLWLLAISISLLGKDEFSFLLFFICILSGIFALGFFVLGFVLSWKHKEIHWKVLRWADVIGLLFFVFAFFYRNLHLTELNLLNDLAQNYERHQTEMDDLVNYARNACVPNCHITIELTLTGKVDRFHVQADGQPNYNWDVSNAQRDSLMALAGLTQAEFENIQKKMKSCHCIWIETGTCSNSGGEPYSSLGYKRVGLGAYSYCIFDKVPSDSVQNDFAKAPSCIRYNERVFFEYGGGAFGPDSFSPAIKQKFLEQHKP